jgi:ribosomal protein S18 acetylase RimI-like enzyme
MRTIGSDPAVWLRLAIEEDAEFVYRARVTGKKGCVTQLWGRDEEEQQAKFAERWATSTYEIVTLEGVDVGVVTVDRHPTELFLGYLGILPEYQRRGLGTLVLQRLLAEGVAAGRPVGLRVLKANHRARRPYQRLGFVVVGETETHDLMRSGGAAGHEAGDGERGRTDES